MSMTRAQTRPDGGRPGTDPTGGGPLTDKFGVPVLATSLEAPACHLKEDANSTLAVLAASNVVSITGEPGRALMQEHRAPMSPLVLLDRVYLSSGRPPRRNLEPRLEKARAGVAHA